MREIKFRAWVDRGYEKFMSTQGEPDLETLSSFMFHYAPDGNSAVIALMQYTGLKDKNGVEIYEGDIVRTDGNSTRAVIWRVTRANVGFNIGKGRYSNSHIRVIGNIYENPELLEQK